MYTINENSNCITVLKKKKKPQGIPDSSPRDAMHGARTYKDQ